MLLTGQMTEDWCRKVDTLNQETNDKVAMNVNNFTTMRIWPEKLWLQSVSPFHKNITLLKGPLITYLLNASNLFRNHLLWAFWLACINPNKFLMNSSSNITFLFDCMFLFCNHSIYCNLFRLFSELLDGTYIIFSSFSWYPRVI